jgi:peptidoglycan hydrolase CwlO-like protein
MTTALNSDKKKRLKAALRSLEAVLPELESMQDELGDEFQQLGAKAQEGAKGTALEEIGDSLGTAACDVQSAIDRITEALEA